MKICGHCKQPVSDKFLAERKKLKSERVSAGLKLAKLNGKNIGRPPRSDVNRKQLIELSALGYSVSYLAKHFNCSVGLVQYTLRKSK